MKHLIVGLGNIGPEYEETRHNVGFMTVDAIAKEKGLEWSAERYAFKCEYKYKGRSIHMIKPTTFMNLSGKAVRHWMSVLKIQKSNVLVIVDDLAIPFGKLRMRAKGSSAGHNGLKNIEQLTGGQDYARLRFGIGDDFSKGKQIDFVLGEFSEDEKAGLPLLIDRSAKMIDGFCTAGIARTMSQYND
ncbi:peptidyl-tRNA hydrolase [Fulvitalea axinellae]|uniref:Peptidyl-tRNA hydrolase n=1 Tax=Fulvitalea axinellae TaxID=1182444 RepID=A0AAU9CJA8_9BACT|nr:peptidyl-tRNA hydrolase [Fulvitalea axinellae]